MTAYTRRDLTILQMGDNTLVIACDTCGAVGAKDGDILKLSPWYVGKFAARVALMEVMCAGATPSVIVNGIACEMNPTGADVILGIQDELTNAGVLDIVLTGSTEENFATCMTALAVTVIGTAPIDGLKFKPAIKGDKFMLLGRPRVGAEVDLESKGLYAELRRLLAMHEIKEIVPVGSKGIAHEVEAIATLNSATHTLYNTGIDYGKSAGPATCMVVLCGEIAVAKILDFCPVALCIGEI